ncbi:MAG: type II secretory pathway pseudopilin PulG [Pseudoalteromonas tetraodonis]|jgi:type II secretory pathway pseudopilin PulG
MEKELKPKPRRNSAFSLIELLIGVATIAVLGAVAVAFLSNSRTSLTASKLEQDVSRLNTAVKIFVANGGDLSGIATGNEVLTELKKSANAEGQKKIVGVRGTSIDNRLYGIDPSHPRGNNALLDRAVWKEQLGRFVIEKSSVGIEEFVYEKGLAHVDFGTQKFEKENDNDRVRQTKLVYNDQEGWVWVVLDRNYVTGAGPQSLPVLEAPTLGASGGSGAANTSRLTAPIISPDSGTLPLASFPLQVTIAKSPSDPEDASVQYSIEPNIWITYSGPLHVEPGTTIQAFTTHADSSWESSEASAANYNNIAETLEIALSIPKNPLTYAEAGGELEPGNYTPVAALEPITVSLPASSEIPDKYENSDNFRVLWTLDGSDPLTSESSQDGSNFSNGYLEDSIDYTLPVWDGASLLPIQIVAKSTNATLVTNSNVHTANININPTDLPAPTFTLLAVDYVEPVEPETEPPPVSDDEEGLSGGHIDVDTSTFIAKIGKGETDGHVHEYDDKYGVTHINYFNLLDSKLDNISDIIPTGKKFKLIVANADLSPGAVLKLNEEYVEGRTYDNTPTGELEVYSIDGHGGTTQLTSLSFHFGTNAITEGGVIPTNTGDVKKNKLGRNGEWRNGALTIQAVEIDSAGNISTNPGLSAGGQQGVASSNLLWESTVFWHWDGDSYHENPDYDPSGWDGYDTVDNSSHDHSSHDHSSDDTTTTETSEGILIAVSGTLLSIGKIIDAGTMPVDARIYYTTDGTDPGDDGNGNPLTGTLYTGPFDPLVGGNHGIEATVVARVYPPADYAPWFNVSESNEVGYSIPAWEISGNSDGWFSNAQGGNSMVSSYEGILVNETVSTRVDETWVDGSWVGGWWHEKRRGGHWHDQTWEDGYWVDGYTETTTETVGGSAFNYGNAAGSGNQDNTLTFTGSSFENVTANQRFEVGSLFYHNGTISSDTEATGIDFSVDLSFGGASTQFDFGFSINSTTNTSDDWNSADFIRFNNSAISAKDVTINGLDYALNLEFDDTSQYGYSNNDNSQFHVQEEHDATAKIYARLVRISMYD